MENNYSTQCNLDCAYSMEKDNCIEGRQYEAKRTHTVCLQKYYSQLIK